MKSSPDKLPRIMYDQSQFTAAYFLDKNGVWLNEEGYKRMGDISGYSPDTWLTYTQNIPESFFFGAYDESALEQEASTGFRNFSDPTFLSAFEAAAKKSYDKARSLKDEYFAEFFERENELIKKDPQKIITFLNKIRTENTFIMSYYFLTQPQRFYTFEEELARAGTNNETGIIATNGRSLTIVSTLRKAILEYAYNVNASGKTYEEYTTEHVDEHATLLQTVDKLGFLNWSLLGGAVIDVPHVKSEILALLTKPQELANERAKLQELTDLVSQRNAWVKINPSKAYTLADIMGHSSVLRFDLQTCILCILKYMDNIFTAAREVYSLSETQLKTYEFNEILKLIESGEKIPEDLSASRQHGYLRIYHVHGSETHIGDDARKKIADLLRHRESEIKNSKFVKGTIASWPDTNRKIITGRAFVLTSAFGADEMILGMMPGDILVATQTHPNLVPKMKEALAIVTDEGGITCHAAIVSRELGKPCIIGTKISTKIFKTGDMIEINSEEKTVRILS